MLKGLYAITSSKLEQNMVTSVAATIAGGASLVQYRNKSANYEQQLWEAQDLQTLCRSLNIPLIINDNVEIAKKVNACGVHLGKDDCQIKSARKILGEKAIIGVSCYNRLDLAIKAQESGADYVAFGSFFASATKPNALSAPLSLLSQAKQRLHIPVVAIGGITANNCQELIQAGADMVAVIEGVFNTSDIKTTAQLIADKFTN